MLKLFKKMNSKVQITIPLNEVNNLKGDYSNVRIDKDSLILDTSMDNYRKIKDKEYISNVKVENKLLQILKKNMIIIIGMILIFFLLYFQSQSVNKIEFENYNTYDENVESSIKKHLYRIGPFFYLDCNLTELSLELKGVYYNYEWIGVRKVGNILYVDINKLDTKNQIIQDDNVVGDLVSKYDAYIKSYKIEKGILLIDVNQTVNKGDVLVSGNLKINVGGTEYIKPKGVVIGDVKEYEIIAIDKNEYSFQSTGKVEVKNKLIFFNKDFENKSKFENYKTTIKEVFVINNFIKLLKIYNYEIIATETKYNLTDGIKYGKSIITKKFQSEKITENEKIMDISYINHVETDDQYIIKFLVHKLINIAEFVETKNED